MAAKLVESLADLEDVSAVALIAGEYDLIVEIPYAWQHAARVIVDQVLSLPGVAATGPSSRYRPSSRRTRTATSSRPGADGS
jgi:hypothetical protein